MGRAGGWCGCGYAAAGVIVEQGLSEGGVVAIAQ